MVRVFELSVCTCLLGLFWAGLMSEAGVLEDVNEKLTSLQASHSAMMQRLEHQHEDDVNNVTQFCQDLKMRVAEQKNLLQTLQQTLQDSSGPPQLEGPCRPENHIVIDDPRRQSNRSAVHSDGGASLCDDGSLMAGWVRFLIHSHNAVLPTTCVPERHCHTDAPTWLDLQGQSLPEVGFELAARACSHWSGECCQWHSPVTLRNCGPFFLYKLQPLQSCNLAFCVEMQGLI